MATLIYHGRGASILWREPVNVGFFEITADLLFALFNGAVVTGQFNLETLETITGITYQTNVSNTNITPNLLVKARQRVYEIMVPQHVGNINFIRPGFTDTRVSNIRFAHYIDGPSTLYDAIVQIIETQSAEAIRHVLSAGLITWQYRSSSDYFPTSELVRITGIESVAQYLRAKLGGDIEPNLDDPVDMEFNAVIPDNPRTFGIEVEFLGNGYTQQYYADAITAALNNFKKKWPIYVRGYGHSDGNFWDLKTDSSCGLELASPALTWEDWPQVETVLKTLYKAGARINDRCGFHVHHMAHDLKATGLRRLLLLWMAYEKAIMLSVKENRRDNRYCIPLNNGVDWEQFKEQLSPLHNMNQAISRMGRYRSLNATGWWQHGRIEIRLYQGTLHPNSCKFWVYLTQQLVEIAKVTRSYEQLDRAVQLTLEENLNAFRTTLYHDSVDGSVKLVETFNDVIKQRNNSSILQGA